MKYRAEIDGLRALAVVPVILFHAGFPAFSGGYVGVDIFFVISGFLITSIMMGDIQADRFSLLTFYERRVRRIFPALFAVLVVSTGLATWLLLADEFNAYARSMFFSTFFLSNHYFMGAGGYFDGPSETQPLLHMWSLAVEEQFYIFFPLILYAVARAALPATLAVLFVLSLVACIWLTAHTPDRAFYLAPTRAWELLAGSLLVVLPYRLSAWRCLSPFTAQVVSGAGLLAIAVAVYSYDNATPFPGSAALLPVLGTVAVIYASTGHKTLVTRLLSLEPVRFIGLISYSLYLWHWPLIVFYRFWRIEHPAPWEMACVMLAAVTMAVLSWHFVERPFRAHRLLGTRTSVLLAGGGAMLASALIAGIIDFRDGFPTRFPDQLNRILAVSRDSYFRQGCRKEVLHADLTVGFCTINDGAPDFAVWGDSHGEIMLHAFDLSSVEAGRSGLSTGVRGCPPLLNVQRSGWDEDCLESSAGIYAYLEASPHLKDIFLVARWSLYANGTPFESAIGKVAYIRDALSSELSVAENEDVLARNTAETVDALTGMGRNVFIVMQAPEIAFDVPNALARSLWLGRDVNLNPSRATHEHQQAPVTALFEGVQVKENVWIIEMTDTMCDVSVCPATRDGLPLYRDSNHLTNAAAQDLWPVLMPYLSGEVTARDD